MTNKIKNFGLSIIKICAKSEKYTQNMHKYAHFGQNEKYMRKICTNVRSA